MGYDLSTMSQDSCGHSRSRETWKFEVIIPRPLEDREASGRFEISSLFPRDKNIGLKKKVRNEAYSSLYSGTTRNETLIINPTRSNQVVRR